MGVESAHLAWKRLRGLGLGSRVAAAAALATLTACRGAARPFVASTAARLEEIGAASPASRAGPRSGPLGRGRGLAARAAARAAAAESFARPRGGIPAAATLAPLALCSCGAVLVRRRARRHRPRARLSAYASAPQTYEGAPIGPPPDLPSLLLKNRIVYLGTPITNEVTELIIAQLLYLNYESADKPVTMYINSTGSTVKNNTRYIGENKVGLETDAFAIADCMQYIKPQVMTIGIGQAYGTAAVLLGLGTKGKRVALPNVTIMLSEPREPPARGPRQAADIQILAREVLQNRETMSDLLARATGKTKEEVVKDTSRCYYMSPDEAVEYNLIDKVLTPEKIREQGQELPSFVSAL